MTRCESYPPCFGTIYFPTAPSSNIPYLFFAVIKIIISPITHSIQNRDNAFSKFC